MPIKNITSSVIVCSRNRLDDLIMMLRSVQHQSALPAELIIVDSSTTPYQEQETFKAVFNPHQWPFTQLNYLHTRPGLTHQRNVGIDHASADILYFFDDDVILETTYLATMQELFATNEQYAGGMGSIINMEPKKRGKHRLFRTIFMLPRDYASGHFTASGMPTHAYGNDAMMSVAALGGCCMAYRSYLFNTYRFDENLPGYGYMEDCDISFRIAQKHQLFYTPHAQLMHNNSPISRDAVHANRAMFINHYSYLFFKNLYPRNKLRVLAWGWSILGLFCEALILRDGEVLRGYVLGLKQFFRPVHLR